MFPGWHVTWPVQTFISWVLLIAALILICWSGIWFFRKKTPIEPHHQPKDLIVEGPYGISRNPIYLALVMLTAASAVGHGSILGLVLAVLLWKILDRRFAEPEEQGLRRAFGEAAEQYFKQTGRWL
ncbi:methyltransferase family protein [Sulfitobacter sp. SK012]|uniref:methyltransferase family protein n=1 Tax=Sulfitobacter sp. SK012 TaxID=1389005 RepID=UPI0013B3A083|nr:isoprenylcysteine carboxylmethyltransferase family protein [Sulfitobacter sp. SK012]